MKNFNTKDDQKIDGFNLMIILVSITLVGTVFSFVFPKILYVIEESALNTEAIENLQVIRIAIEHCRLTNSQDACKCTIGSGPQLSLDWNILGLEDPGKMPNAHFSYVSSECGVSPNYSYIICADRNALSNEEQGNRYLCFAYSDSNGSKFMRWKEPSQQGNLR